MNKKVFHHELDLRHRRKVVNFARISKGEIKCELQAAYRLLGILHAAGKVHEKVIPKAAVVEHQDPQCHGESGYHDKYCMSSNFISLFSYPVCK